MIIVRSAIACLCRSQYLVFLSLVLIICTLVTTVVFIPNEAVAQQLRRTSQNATSAPDLVTVLLDNAAHSLQIGNNKDKAREELTIVLIDHDSIKAIQNGDKNGGVEHMKLINQQLSMLPNSTSISEQIAAKSSPSNDLAAMGKVGEIILEGDARGIGINPKTNLIYISQNLDGPPHAVVSIIDGKTNSVVKDIDVIPDPQAIAINDNINMIYVTHPDSNVISVIDGKTNSVVKAIVTGIQPQTVAVNPNTNMIYVTNSVDDTISVIDGKTNSVVKAIVTGIQPTGLAVNSNTNRVYAGNIVSNTLSIIDGKTNSVVKNVENLSAAQIAVNPLTNIIYLGKIGCLCVMDGKTNSVIRNITWPMTNSISINDNTNTIYITGFDNSSASIIDGKTNSVVKNVNLNTTSTNIAVNPRNNLTYTVLPQARKIVVSDSKLSAFPLDIKTINKK